MKIVSLNKGIEKYHYLSDMEYMQPGFKGHQIGMCIGAKDKVSNQWVNIYTPGETPEAKLKLINSILEDKSLIILEEEVTQFDNDKLVTRIMYFLPYYVENHSAYKPTINFENISFSMNIRQTVEYEVLLVGEQGWHNRYLNFSYVTGPSGYDGGRCTTFYEMIKGLESTIEEAANDKSNTDITIATHNDDNYSKGNYLITFYDKKGEAYVVGFNCIEEILHCVTSVRLVRYEYEIIDNNPSLKDIKE